MGWLVYGRPFETGELSNTNRFQSVKFTKNVILKAIRTWVIFYNNPTITDLTCKVYSNEIVDSENTPKKLLYSATSSLTKSEMITLENGVKEIYFDFAEVPLSGEEIYNFVLEGNGYVYSLGSHVAWRVGWPDPVYTAGFTPNAVNLGRAPYTFYAIGADF